MNFGKIYSHNLKMKFINRYDAGQKLANKLLKYKSTNSIVLTLPRGGVPVGYEVAKSLRCQISVLVVSKLPAPNQPELGFGAISENGKIVFDNEIIDQLNISSVEIANIIKEQVTEVQRRVAVYRLNSAILNTTDKIVILVDDGLATGVSAKVAVFAIREYKPKKIVFALPVCARDVIHELSKIVDEIVCLKIPEEFKSVGNWYEDFGQLSDEDVIHLLKRSTSLKHVSKTQK